MGGAPCYSIVNRLIKVDGLAPLSRGNNQQEDDPYFKSVWSGQLNQFESRRASLEGNEASFARR